MHAACAIFKRGGLAFYTLIFSVCFLMFVMPRTVFAACVLPNGAEGEIIYNIVRKKPQYCDGKRWVGLGWKGAPGASTRPQKVIQSYIKGAENWSADLSLVKIGGVWDSTVKGIRVAGDKMWESTEFLPINPGQKWFMTVTVQNVGSVPTRFYAGVRSFDQDFYEVATDAMHSFNYHAANAEWLNAGENKVFSATMYGWNPVGGTGPGFDPKASYFRPLILFNYHTPAGSIVLQGISVFPVP